VSFPSDLAIAQSARLKPIEEVASGLGLSPESLVMHGKYAAKVDLGVVGCGKGQTGTTRCGKYIVVTAITPTPLGEGKTTTAVGLGQAMSHMGKCGVLTLRQPSLGPTFGIKGGAAGGGYSQVVPMEKMNLHLTGDFHAVTAAHNMLAAIVDNHLFQGNAQQIDINRIVWRRVLDVNDRSLRNIRIGLGGDKHGVPRDSGFDITAASEVMAILSMASSYKDLRTRLSRIVVGYRTNGCPVTAEDVDGAGAMAVLLRDALQPNLLQTLEHTPVLVHTGPFGNIATGSSSVIADLIALQSADYVFTEAGFGADMGAERFFNIKCRASGLIPDAAVVVATVRALKVHSGNYRVIAGRPLPPELLEENPEDVRAGADNLLKHIEIVRMHGVSPVVAVNAFPTDHPSEIQVIKDIATSAGARVAVSTHFTDGGSGAIDLAREVIAACDEPTQFQLLYPDDMSLVDKMHTIAEKVYGASHVEYSDTAAQQMKHFEQLGFGHLPLCVAKTHLSISADPSLRGAPTGHTVRVREVRASVGAGFIYPICGEMTTMPGLGAQPGAYNMDIDDEGNIIGLS
jgi:formate--tetrahydrofolate ligase